MGKRYYNRSDLQRDNPKILCCKRQRWENWNSFSIWRRCNILYHRKGELPPAPPSPPSHLLKSGGGFLPRVNTKDSNKYIPTRNQGGIKSSIIKELEKILGGKRPDSEISISTARYSTISSSDYRLTDWK